VTHGEHAVFDGADPVDAPLIVGDRLRELALDRGLRVEAVDDFFGELVVGGHVFRWEDDNARGESVAQGVHAGTGFTRWGRGTTTRSAWVVEPVGGVLGGRRHVVKDLRSGYSRRAEGRRVKMLILLEEWPVNRCPTIRLNGQTIVVQVSNEGCPRMRHADRSP